jgi:hypothetical protein
VRHQVQRWSAVLVVALATATAGCSDDPGDQAGARDDNWIPFESSEGGFRVELPSLPETNAESVPSPSGPLEAAVFTVEASRDVGYIVAYTDYPEDVLDLDPVVALDQAVQEAASNVSGTLESSTRLTVEGFPAVDYVIAVDEGRLEARAILTGRRIYLVQRAARQPDQADFRRLVDSFGLLET